MTVGTMLRAGILGVACMMAFANCEASAEDAQGANPAQPAAASESAAPKTKHKKHVGKKTDESGDATASASSKPKRGQFSSEADAKAHCKGEVVWVDKDHFNHYAGSREYGRQPGAFACEN